jgi:hypothetical protein
MGNIYYLMGKLGEDDSPVDMIIGEALYYDRVIMLSKGFRGSHMDNFEGYRDYKQWDLALVNNQNNGRLRQSSMYNEPSCFIKELEDRLTLNVVLCKTSTMGLDSIQYAINDSVAQSQARFEQYSRNHKQFLKDYAGDPELVDFIRPKGLFGKRMDASYMIEFGLETSDGSWLLQTTGLLGPF